MTQMLRPGTNEPFYNEGNFQEYEYELEWMECSWKMVHDTVHLVTAYWYPWIKDQY